MTPMQLAVAGIEQAATFFCADLEALSEKQILVSAGGCARVPVDFAYEVALVNRRIAARLSGVEPPPAPEGDDWWVALDEYRSKAAIIRYVRESCDELIAAAKAIPEEEAAKMVGAPGFEHPAYGLVNFAAMHTMYHDAQLNFVQSLGGDLQMHWPMG